MGSFFNRDGTRSINFSLYKKEIKELRKQWQSFVNEIPDYPATKFKGKGIVMCAGKVSYFTCCWISIQVLRKKKCDLPIEVWYVDEELSDAVRTALAKLNVMCKNVSEYSTDKVSGWALKPFSILHSQFKEILFLDADNVCIYNPDNLFLHSRFKKHGNFFWPDLWKTQDCNPIWSVIGKPPSDMPEQESGQLLVDKEKCWKELNLAYYFNQKTVPYHYLLYGDKDTFKFAWLALGTTFHMEEKAPTMCGYKGMDSPENLYGITMLQHVDGIPFFLHRNLLKWDITLPREKVWQYLKQFKSDAETKEILLKKEDAKGHWYVDLIGNTEEFRTPDNIKELEGTCLEILSKLKKSSLFNDFLSFRYIIEKRYRK